MLDFGCDCVPEEERPIYSSWNMAEFMPPLAQEYFEVVVSEFVYLPWKETQRMLLEGEGRASGMQDMDDGMVALTPAAGQSVYIGVVSVTRCDAESSI